MTAFVGLAIVSSLLAYMFSSVSLEDAGTYKWILTVVAIVYLVFLTMMSMMKKIVGFAEDEVWTHPKRRNKKTR